MMPSADAWQDLVTFGDRSGTDLWLGLVAAVAIGIAMACFALALFGTHRKLHQRISDLQDLLAVHVQRTGGPTVRHFCGRLIDVLNLRRPRSSPAKSAAHEEVQLVRGLLMALRARARKRRRSERLFEDLRREIDLLRVQVRNREQSETGGAAELRRLQSEAASRAAAVAHLTEQNAEAASRIGDLENQLADFSGDKTSTVASLDRLDHRMDQMEERLAVADNTEPQHAMAASRIDGLENQLADLANHKESTDASPDKLDDRIDQLEERLAAADDINSQHTLAASRIDGVENQLADLASHKVSMDASLDRMDHRIEQFVERLAAAEDIEPGQPDDDSPAPEIQRAEAVTASIKTLLTEAAGVDDRLVATRNASEETRQALQAADAALQGQLDQRQNLIDRIDQQLRERQIQLVTDILKAEGWHLELTRALSAVDQAVSSLQETTGLVGLIPSHRENEDDSPVAAASDRTPEPTYSE